MFRQVISFFVIALLVVACGDDGGSSPEGEPIVSGTATVTWGDETRTLKNGLVRYPRDDNGEPQTDQGLNFVLGNGPYSCEPQVLLPTGGFGVTADLPGTEAGATADDIVIQVFNFEGETIYGRGTTGTVTINSIDAETVSGTLSMTMQDDEFGTIGIEADLTVRRCDQ